MGCLTDRSSFNSKIGRAARQNSIFFMFPIIPRAPKQQRTNRLGQRWVFQILAERWKGWGKNAQWRWGWDLLDGLSNRTGWYSENGGNQSADSKEDVRECTSGKRFSEASWILLWSLDPEIEILMIGIWGYVGHAASQGLLPEWKVQRKALLVLLIAPWFFQNLNKLKNWLLFSFICMWTSVNITSRTWLMEMIMSILLFQIVVWYLGCSRKLHLGHKHFCSFLHPCGVNLYEEVTYCNPL